MEERERENNIAYNTETKTINKNKAEKEEINEERDEEWMLILK